MTGRVYIEVQSEIPGGVLLVRDKIQKMDPEIEWLYDDAVQVLEMDGWFKWWNADEQLTQLNIEHPELKLFWTIDHE